MIKKRNKILFGIFCIFAVVVTISILLSSKSNSVQNPKSIYTPSEFSLSDPAKIEKISDRIRLINGTGGYDTNNPYVISTDNVTYTALFGFEEVLGSNNQGSISYQISNNGSDWYWWDTSWSLTTNGYENSNSASVINSHISLFTSQVGAGNFFYKAFFHAATNSTQVELDHVDVSYSSAVSPSISSISPNYSVTTGGSIDRILGTNFVAGSYGDGHDGSVDVSANRNINLDAVATNRTCADGINYSVTALTSSSATLYTTPTSDCLAEGDEVLLINLQGITAAYDNVGNYETLKIDSIVGNVINFTTAKTKYYGDGSNDNNLGVATTNQRVMLQRVPNYLNMTIDSGKIVSANNWDGIKGGVIFFRVNGEFINNGTITVSGSGYRPGLSAPHSGYVDKRGGEGETINADYTTRSASPNLGGGGGGHPGQSGSYWMNGAGGASHATAGGNGTQGGGNGNSVGYGATYTYGEVGLVDKIYFGSGGGSSNGYGGSGGGIILIDVAKLTTLGSVTANGSPTNSYDNVCGGSGSGGSIKIIAPDINLGSSQVSAQGTTTYYYGNSNSQGGSGGSGRIALVYSGSTSGTSSPSANATQDQSLSFPTRVKIDNQLIDAAVISSTEIRVITASHSLGTVDVEIINPDNQRDILTDGIEYIPPPEISSISPSSVAKTGGSTITISGENFRPNPQITFNGVSAVSVEYVNSTTVRAVVPSNTSGFAQMQYFNDDGYVLNYNQFYYFLDAVTLSSITPNIGSISGGTEVTVTGSNFTPGDFGTGIDGSVTINANKNMNTDIISSSRTCADGKNYSVLSLTRLTATLDSSPASNCLAVGDEVLLINLQGTSSNYVNVGNYETLKIANIDGSLITFETSKLFYYGFEANSDNHIGKGTTEQRVMLQRVPNYINMTVNSNITLTSDAWDGTKNGVLFFRINGTLTNNGIITTSNIGYRYGNAAAGGQAQQGESYTGYGTYTTLANGGGGGGGYTSGCSAAQGGPANYTSGGSSAFGSTGGGGGYYVVGATGTTYGGQNKLMFGSGGGGGSHNCHANYGRGGSGGGAIAIFSSTLSNYGVISAQGETGNSGNGDSAGGSGSGGSIYLYSKISTLGSNLVNASGGTVVPGGDGELLINYANSNSGTTASSSTISQYSPKLININFDNVLASSIVFVDSNTLTANTPAHISDTVNISVETPDGQTVNLNNAFTYILADSTPLDPYVNNVSAQTGIASPASDIYFSGVKFSAKFSSSQEDAVSSAYRVLVSTDNTFTQTLWDSGKVTLTGCANLTRCSDVSYGGSALATQTNYFWKIRFWDNQNVQGNWSDVLMFTTSSGYSIIEKPSNLILFNAENWATNISNTALLGIVNVGIENSKSIKIAEVSINYNQNHNWSTITADSGDNKAFFHVPGGIASLPGYDTVGNEGFSLFVQKNNGDKVFICPGADNLSAISITCSGGYYLDESSNNVSIDSLNGILYWKISGLSSTGGMSVITGLRDALNRLEKGTGSNHELIFGTNYGLTAGTSDTIVLNFDTENKQFNLSSLSLDDIYLTDNVGTTKTLASSPSENTWGVEINTTEDTITFSVPTSGTGGFVPADLIIIKIGLNVVGGTHQIINPDNAGTVQEKITINNSVGEEGTLAIPIVDSDTVDITGTVTNYIEFDIDTGTGEIPGTDNAIDCNSSGLGACLTYSGGSSADNYTVDLGQLTSLAVNQSNTGSVTHSDGPSGIINSIYFDLTTNVPQGAVVTVSSANQGLQGIDSSKILSVTDGENILVNSGKYGFNLPVASHLIYGSIVKNSYCDTDGKYCGPTTLPKTVFTTNNAQAELARVRMDIAAAAAYTNTPGSYTDTLTFIATGTF